MSRKNLPANTSSYQPVTYLADGAPYSAQFDDIYFDTTQGIAQSQVIFIEGNQLKTRWQDFSGEVFTIAETGFGTGLNFLLTLCAFEQWLNQSEHNKQGLKLHFISVEKYPLSPAELSKALAVVPQLAIYAEQLLASYVIENKEILELSLFDNKVRLTVYLGDATTSYQALAQSQPCSVNAWFLDGFSPAKNPEMWHSGLYQMMAKLSADNASLATFTVAGHVRRGLTEAGFRVEKTTTSLNKNHILTGRFQTAIYEGKGYKIRPIVSKPDRVTIIGGGIASACLAWSLSKKGIKVQLLCKDEALAQEASSNAIGAIYPLIHQTPDIISHFFSQAFFHARQYYDELLAQGFSFDHSWCGVMEVAHNDALKARVQKFARLNSWPHELVHAIDEHQANQLAKVEINRPALFFPKAGWASPQQLVGQLINAAVATGNCKLRLNQHVQQIKQLDDHSWQITTAKREYHSSLLIICGGADSNLITGFQGADIYPVQGQVSVMKSTAKSQKLATVLCHKGYVTPANNSQQCIGATFKKQVNDKKVTQADNEYNLKQLNTGLPNVFDWQIDDIISANAKVRACTSDHLPIVGIMPDIDGHIDAYAKLKQDSRIQIETPQPVVNNLYLLAGLGARGLCSAPLLADILAAELSGGVYPVDQAMLFNLAPNRFIIKDIIRGKVGKV